MDDGWAFVIAFVSGCNPAEAKRIVQSCSHSQIAEQYAFKQALKSLQPSSPMF